MSVAAGENDSNLMNLVNSNPDFLLWKKIKTTFYLKNNVYLPVNYTSGAF